MGYFHGVIGGNMGGVSIEESGLGFVWVCLQKYWGTCLLPALFLAGILWSLLRHRNREAGIFLFFHRRLPGFYYPIYEVFQGNMPQGQSRLGRRFWDLMAELLQLL